MLVTLQRFDQDHEQDEMAVPNYITFLFILTADIAPYHWICKYALPYANMMATYMYSDYIMQMCVNNTKYKTQSIYQAILKEIKKKVRSA